MDVANSSDGTQITENDYLNTSTQQWQLVPQTGGYYEIKNTGSGKAMDMTGGYLFGGALLQQWDFLGGLNQQWRLVPVGN
jgi:hypothetical protein